MAYEPFDFLTKGSPDALVNENVPPAEQPAGYVPFAGVIGDQLSVTDPKAFAFDAAQARRKNSLPKTWFGEFWNAGKQGVDQLQQLGYETGAFASESVGADKVRDWFVKGSEQQDKEILGEPINIESSDKVDNFDSFMRWFAGAAGKAAPQLAESAATAGIGSALGSAVEPGGGTLLGGIGGFVEKQAIRNIMKEGLKEATFGAAGKGIGKEMVDYATGKIAKEALSETAQAALVNETKNLMGLYGTTVAIGLNSWGQETASIYGDLRKDPNQSESDRKTAALLYGLAAALPDTALEGYIASKFFPGVRTVTKPELDQAKSYLVEFAKKAAKEIPKVTTAEFGQEYAQTLVEEAAKNWANPATRDQVLSFTPEQMQSALESGLQGAVGGIMGGGVAAFGETRVPPHPNPQVRNIERDVITKANDESGDILSQLGPDDERLSVISKRQEEISAALTSPDLLPQVKTQLEEEQAKLAAEESSILTEPVTTASPLVNEKPAEIVAPEPDKSVETTPIKAPTPAERQVGILRAFYGERMASGEPATRANAATDTQLQETAKQVDSLVNEIGNDRDQPEATANYQQAVKEVFTPDVTNFLAAEGIELRAGENFQVHDEGDAKIVLAIPKASHFLALDYGDRGTGPMRSIPTMLAHEIIHVADLVAMRDEWNSGGKELSFSKFEERATAERGKSLIDAIPKLPWELRKAYDTSGKGRLTDRQVGQEFPRMIVEFARLGKLTEVTIALGHAERDADTGGVIDKFLRQWVNAIKQIHKRIIKFLDPKHTPPELLKVYHQINKTLDQYGLLVNETKSEEQVIKQKDAAVGLDLPEGSNVKLNTPDLSSKQKSEQKPGFQKVKGKVKDLRTELKRPAKAETPTQPQPYPDETPEGIAAATGTRFEGEGIRSQWLFTDLNVGSPSYGTTFTTPVGASLEYLQGKLEEKQKQFSDAGPPVTEANLDDFLAKFMAENKPPAKGSRPPIRERDQKALQEALNETNRASNKVYGNIQAKPATDERVKGEVPWGGMTPQDLFYSTRTHTQSAINAQVLVNESKDALSLAEKLISDPLGQNLDIPKGEDGEEFGPSATLRATYENLIRQLIGVNKKLGDAGVSIAVRSYVRDLTRRLEGIMRRMGNVTGAYNAYTGQSENLYTGETARREYVETILDAAEKVLGKTAKAKMQKLAAELNEVWTRYAGVVANSPKIIAALRKVQRLVTGIKFEKGYRQTLAKSLDKLKAITKKAAARAADYIAQNEDGEAYANKAAQNIVSEMSGLPKEANQRTELELFQFVVSKMARSMGREMGLISESAKQHKPTMEEQFAVILKNERLYDTFTRALRTEFIKEYGGLNPGPTFLTEADMLYGKLANRMWNDGMVTSLVNEKMRGINLKLAEIVKEHYARGNYEVDRIRNEVATYMKSQGVENPALIDGLVKDVEDEMHDRVEAAREKFFSSAKTIKDFLKAHKITLAQAATDYAIHADQMTEKFAETLVNDYGFPDSPDMPIATQMAEIMQKEFNGMVEGENSKIVQRWLDQAAKGSDDKTKRKMEQAVDKILKLAKAGVMRQEDVYRALQDQFGLPKYSPEIAAEIEGIGDMLYEANSDRTKNTLRQQLATLIASNKGLSTTESYVSWMYYSMLSGLSTPLVNIGGNLTSLMGYVTIESIKNPRQIGGMLRSLWRAASGSAYNEMRESFWTGMALGKEGQKYFRGANVGEIPSPQFQSPLVNERLKKLDEGFAAFTHKLLRGLKGQYFGRALMATDIYFYKLAQEAAYTTKMKGQGGGTPQMWLSAQDAARTEMAAIGQTPEDNRDMRRRHQVLSNSIYENLRLRDAQGNLIPEKEAAWNDSNNDARDATFTQEPKYFLGYLAKHIERFTNDWPAAKLIIPFTRVAANVTNMMLEWTPYGFARYGLQSLKNEANPFKLIEDGQWKNESDIALRAMLGTAAMMILFASASSPDDEDPDFAVYADGPRDPNARRLLQERGWKPNSIKIGGAYWSYLYTPLAMAFSIVGRHYDDYRDGRLQSPSDISMATSAVALLEAVKNQSFLASVSDLMAAVDSPDPQARLSKVFARFATIPIPNLFKQTDKFFDPTIQQAQGFYETVLKELPLARHTLRPALNVFGEEIERTPGLVRIPGMDRFVTGEKTNDPVLNLLSERNLKMPGFSKGTRLGNDNMTVEQYYEYVKIAGPRIKQRLEAESYSLREMTKEDAQDRIERIATEEKRAARGIMLEGSR